MAPSVRASRIATIAAWTLVACGALLVDACQSASSPATSGTDVDASASTTGDSGASAPSSDSGAASNAPGDGSTSCTMTFRKLASGVFGTGSVLGLTDATVFVGTPAGPSPNDLAYVDKAGGTVNRIPITTEPVTDMFVDGKWLYLVHKPFFLMRIDRALVTPGLAQPFAGSAGFYPALNGGFAHDGWIYYGCVTYAASSDPSHPYVTDKLCRQLPRGMVSEPTFGTDTFDMTLNGPWSHLRFDGTHVYYISADTDPGVLGRVHLFEQTLGSNTFTELGIGPGQSFPFTLAAGGLVYQRNAQDAQFKWYSQFYRRDGTLILDDHEARLAKQLAGASDAFYYAATRDDGKDILVRVDLPSGHRTVLYEGRVDGIAADESGVYWGDAATGDVSAYYACGAAAADAQQLGTRCGFDRSGTSNGSSCTQDCRPDRDVGTPCEHGDDCCSGRCAEGVCAYPCKAEGQACSSAPTAQCCDQFSNGNPNAIICGTSGTCCRDAPGSCTTDADCCAGMGLTCVNGTCRYPCVGFGQGCDPKSQNALCCASDGNGALACPAASSAADAQAPKCCRAAQATCSTDGECCPGLSCFSSHCCDPAVSSCGAPPVNSPPAAG